MDGRDVRLQGINALEWVQPYGTQAAMALRGAVLDWRVRLEVQSIDRHDPLVAMVYRGDRNINHWLARQGHAWEYDRYFEDWMLAGLEWLVWSMGCGLWAADDRVPPWKWRPGRPHLGGGESPEPDRDCSDFSPGPSG